MFVSDLHSLKCSVKTLQATVPLLLYLSLSLPFILNLRLHNSLLVVCDFSLTSDLVHNLMCSFHNCFSATVLLQDVLPSFLSTLSHLYFSHSFNVVGLRKVVRFANKAENKPLKLCVFLRASPNMAVSAV